MKAWLWLAHALRLFRLRFWGRHSAVPKMLTRTSRKPSGRFNYPTPVRRIDAPTPGGTNRAPTHGANRTARRRTVRAQVQAPARIGAVRTSAERSPGRPAGTVEVNRTTRRQIGGAPHARRRSVQAQESPAIAPVL